MFCHCVELYLKSLYQHNAIEQACYIIIMWHHSMLAHMLQGNWLKTWRQLAQTPLWLCTYTLKQHYNLADLFSSLKGTPIDNDSFVDVTVTMWTMACSVTLMRPTAPANTSTSVFECFFQSSMIINLWLLLTQTVVACIQVATYGITSAMESDEGMYTCRLKGNQRSTTVTVQLCECHGLKIVYL